MSRAVDPSILEKVTAERDEARATIARLNRRVQTAEAAVHELTHGTGRGKSRPVAAEIWERCVESHGEHCPAVKAATDEYDALLTKMGGILTAVAAAVNGPPPPLVSWSHHDLAEKVGAVVAERDALRVAVGNGGGAL